jgi:hypothetical protein
MALGTTRDITISGEFAGWKNLKGNTRRRRKTRLLPHARVSPLNVLSGLTGTNAISINKN